MERLRAEMMDNAKWKEQVKKDNANFVRAELAKEEKTNEEGNKTNANFIK